MQIIINRNAQQQMVLIKTIAKQFYYKQYAVASALAVVALILMFTKMHVKDEILPFWNPFSAIALSILTLTTLRLGGLFKQHKLMLASKPQSIDIIINDDAISYRTETHEAKFQWSYFKYYRLNGQLITLAKDTTNKSTLIIDKNEISDDGLKFLQSLFFSKKISRR